MSVTNTSKEMTDCIIKPESFSAGHFFILPAYKIWKAYFYFGYPDEI
jgi:hypothetical protein